MQNAPEPIDLINSTAKVYSIQLENEQVECLFFVFAHVLKEVGERLEANIKSKLSIEEMEVALDKIHYKINYFKVSDYINENDRRYSDIEYISPTLETVIAQLRAMLDIYNDTLPDPRRRPEKLRLRTEAITLYNEKSLACRRCVTGINQHVEWWMDETQTAGCQAFRSAG